MRIVIIVCCFLGTVTSQSPPCPHGWFYRGSSCYAFFTDAPATWTEAEVHCNLMQSRLVEIETVVEDEFLEVHLMNNGFKGDFWIGLSDILVDGEWLWMSTQTVAQYTNWWPGEPNNYHSIAEDCAALHGRMFHWYDIPCSRKNNFICEKEAHGHEHWVVVG
ncbi:perlucin-like [Crassostrea angulata]|uniref:perlucin-like n=1 Tax=Magallana angulata TaxID=2784310 RepID=UPI0022B21A22|nr:perlucin-like [Crassostrea angulata]